MGVIETREGRRRATTERRIIVRAAWSTIKEEGKAKWKWVRQALLTKIAPREEPQKKRTAAATFRTEGVSEEDMDCIGETGVGWCIGNAMGEAESWRRR